MLIPRPRFELGRWRAKLADADDSTLRLIIEDSPDGWLSLAGAVRAVRRDNRRLHLIAMVHQEVHACPLGIVTRARGCPDEAVRALARFREAVPQDIGLTTEVTYD
jgi:hypothetical protein